MNENIDSEDLLENAKKVRDEQFPSQNSAKRVGDVLVDIVDYQKYNNDKIEDKLENTVSIDSDRLLTIIPNSNISIPIIVDKNKNLILGYDLFEQKLIIPNIEKSLINKINLSSLDNDLFDTVKGLRQIENTVKFISNNEYLIAFLDISDKIILGINRDFKLILGGKNVLDNDFYGFNKKISDEWLINFVSKDNKILWGINKDGKIFPTDNIIDDITKNVKNIDIKCNEAINNINFIDGKNQLLDLNFKGFFSKKEDLEKNYPLSSISYVNKNLAFKPNLLSNEIKAFGNLDQKFWYASVGGLFSYIKYDLEKETYKWFVSSEFFEKKQSTGCKLAVYNDKTLLSFEDKLKETFITNSVFVSVDYQSIINFNPNLLIYPNVGFEEMKNGTDLNTYLNQLENQFKKYFETIYNIDIVCLSAKKIDTTYNNWIDAIKAKCNDFSVKFIDFDIESCINNFNLSNFVINENLFNDKYSKKLSRSILNNNSNIEKSKFYQKKEIPSIHINIENGLFFEGKPKDTKYKILDIYVDVKSSGLKPLKGVLSPNKDEIRGRGNTTWFPNKKPYRLKFNNKISFFGNEQEKNWVLLAAFYDKTTLRPSLGHEIGFKINKKNIWYVPTQQLVELYLNGRYEGLYCLTDHIGKPAKSRINIVEPKPEDIAFFNEQKKHYVLKDDIDLNTSGGFIYEMDTDSRAIEKIGKPIVDNNNIIVGSEGDVIIRCGYGINKQRYFNVRSLEFYINDFVTSQNPNGVVLQSFMNYAKQFIDKVNDVIMSDVITINGLTYKQRLEEYIDISSFVKYYWCMEISKNPDSRDFSSIYYYKDRDKIIDNKIVTGKLVSGPIWDVDLGFGNNREFDFIQNPEGWFIRGNEWTKALLRDREIKQIYINMWHDLDLKNTYMGIIDKLVCQSYEPAIRNNKRWSNEISYFEENLAGFNQINSKNYEIQVSFLKKWMENRINWIEKNIQNL